MKNSYDSLNDTFNTDPVDDTAIVKEEKRKNQIQKLTDDVSKDYDYTRGNLYSLIEKGQEAINGIMEVAGETASPRAYEVAGQLIKSVAAFFVAMFPTMRGVFFKTFFAFSINFRVVFVCA